MSAKKAKSPKPTAVEAIQHKDERLNLPTPELSRLAEPSEPEPEVRRYPRRPELDPQLVWKGKDQEDEGDLAVPIVPLYLQEKIHPQTLIEEIRKEGAKEAIPLSGSMQADLFAPLKEHPDPSHKIEFYQHAERWTNRLVLGDSLLVMTSLAEKEGLKGQVQTVYFDPPYGINFSSNWQATTDSRKQALRG